MEKWVLVHTYTLRRLLNVIGIFITMLICGMLWHPYMSHGDTVVELQNQINDHNSQIQKLNEEIAQYQKQLNATSGERKTLQSKIAQIQLTIKKTNTEIAATQQKITAKNLELSKLGSQINTKQSQLDIERAGLAQSIRSLREIEKVPVVAQVLAQEKMSDVWRDIDRSTTLQTAIVNHTRAIQQQKVDLEHMQQQVSTTKDDLLEQTQELQTQKGSLNASQQTQNQLLTQTKKKEATYQQIIAQKKKQEQQFEAALMDLQSKLKVAISAADIAAAGDGVLQWPVSKIVITQTFGNTAFAASGAYNGKGHNGIDLGVPVGTPIKASMAGTVVGTGNTDAIAGCYSFGKWVLLKHANNLDTLYAHLSSIGVSEGDSVTTGQVIGYSGETGYATGPHLHFGVYVSSATKIMRLGDATNSSTPCSGARMPIAPLAAYLNPMNYLPKR